MIAKSIQQIKTKLGERARLIAVSKTKPISSIMEAYEAGHKIFGENKVQELCEKYESLPKDIEWHMIGHLQTNKVKYIAPFVQLIHGVDSLKLAAEISKQGEKNNRKIPCLFQMHIAAEETKFGFSEHELLELLQQGVINELPGITWCGMMGMATFTDDTGKIRQEFKNLKQIFDTVKKEFFSHQSEFKEVSMGMSGDWPIAVEEGATLVRIGSAIFGER
ncbi:MAG: YggS family pyridoxal phosphate-dependent enzyme [Flavobacteriales bacterium]|nr:YggS family pyridoxal phosphate-dependent enzyme [Flavobacteriales bacterium]